MAAAIDLDGALDRGFGSDGVSHVRAAGEGFQTLSVLVRPDRRLLVAGTRPTAQPLQLPELTLVGLTADGRLDASFGDGGVTQPGSQGSCANCSPVGLAPDGTIVATRAPPTSPAC